MPRNRHLIDVNTKILIDVLIMKQSKADPCIFYKCENGRLVLTIVIYVDDALCTGPQKWIQWAFETIESKFTIARLGKLKKHLGIWWEWKKDEGGNTYLMATMPKMIKEISEKFIQATGKKAKPAPTPGFPGTVLTKNDGDMVMLDHYRSIVGKLMYYMTKIAPEICNPVRDLSSHMTNPGKEHWKALERCVGYVCEDVHKGLLFRKPRELRSISTCDSDYAKDETDRRSISGRINTLGGMITNWSSKKQSTVSLSSTQAEYQALSECAQESVFTQNLIIEMTGEKLMSIIYEDNLGAIYLVKNQQVSPRTKHIDIRHHYLRELQGDRLDVRFVRSEDNSSDIMTKNTARELFEKHAKRIREGLLSCWKEDVKSDPSVAMYGSARRQEG